MSIVNRQTFDTLQDAYREWVNDHAAEGVVVRDLQSMISRPMINDTEYEDDTLILDRVYYWIPLLPSESKSGKLETFNFSELNILFKDPDDEVTHVASGEYRLE